MAPRSKLSVKNKKKQDDIRELANKVRDEEIEGFACEIPSEEAMNGCNFPNPCFNRQSLDWLSQNMLIGCGEWGEAWAVVVKEDDIDDNFLMFPEEKKIEYRKRMVEIARRRKRVVLYKKWRYALEKIQKEKYDKEWAWDEDWSTESEGVIGGKGNEIVVDGDKHQAVVHGDGNKAVVHGDRKENVEVKMVGKGEEVQMDDIHEESTMTTKVTDDDYPYRAECTLVKPTSRSGFDFPLFSDHDDILYYENPFSLESWLKKHEPTNTRWLQTYTDWSEKYKWKTVDDWTGDRLRRECSAIIQSIVIGVLDYHSFHGPHGNLFETSNFKLSQYVENFGGVKKIRFKTELLNPDHNLQSQRGDNSIAFQCIAKDMYELILIVQKILEGRKLDFEMNQFVSLLSSYPFDEKTCWKNLLLRNFPGLWDGQERATFIVDFYYNLSSDLAKSKLLLKALQVAENILGKPYGWITKIPVHSVFYDILVDSHHVTTDIESEPRPHYREGVFLEIVRYMRAVLRHHNETHGATMDIRLIELCLSQLFPGAIFAIYTGMCNYNIYLS